MSMEEDSIHINIIEQEEMETKSDDECVFLLLPNNKRKKIKREENYANMCFICFDVELTVPLQKATRLLQPEKLQTCGCNHSVHIICLRRWYNVKTNWINNIVRCPLCNTKYSEKLHFQSKHFDLIYSYMKFITQLCLFLLFSWCFVLFFILYVYFVFYVNHNFTKPYSA